MRVYEGDDVRNIGIVGHGDCGKTSALAAFLYTAGSTNRFTKVDEGNTVTDFDEEEVNRKVTITSSLAYLEWNKTKINFIDTPGMANFFSDACCALRVADAALVVVDAVAGSEVLTEKVWGVAEELRLPCVVVLNRLDRERASLPRSKISTRSLEPWASSSRLRWASSPSAC